MDYQTLTDVLGQSKIGATPAPSLNSIIQGIQSQYEPVPSMPIQSGMYGANRYISGQPQFGAIDIIPEYGRLSQLAGPSFVPSAFNKDSYSGIDSQKLSDLISTISNDYGGDSTGTPGPSVDSDGMATNPNISPTAVTAMAMTLGAITGLPVSLITSVVGKQNIANTINAQSAAQATAQNQAAVAAMMGIPNTPENQITIQQAIDSLSAINAQTNPAISASQQAQGVQGITGAVAGAAGVAGATAAAAAGHSDAAIGAAAQAASNAALSGLSTAAQAQAASDAAATVDGGTTGPGSAAGIGVGSTTGINSMDAASDAATAASTAAANAAADGVGASGIGDGSSGTGAGDSGAGSGSAGDGAGGAGAGTGLAMGGIVLEKHLAGPNPYGPDDGYVPLKLGEYVIKQSAVNKYGPDIFDLINQGKISKKAIRSLL